MSSLQSIGGRIAAQVSDAVNSVDLDSVRRTLADGGASLLQDDKDAEA